VREGLALIEGWQPDLLYSSSPPHTGLLVASYLCRRTATPWIAEFRDLWVHDPYYDSPFWLKPYERWLERRALSHVSGLVTVTETCQELMARVTGKPTILSRNGFDPEDFSGAQANESPADAPLNIVYAGSLYQGRRDPSALFQALVRLGNAADQFRVHFYTSELAYLRGLAASYGLEAVVELHDPVPHGEIVRVFLEADILLLLRWDHPSERGVIAGKLYEYVGAGRPILSLGATEGEAADLIRAFHLGEVTNDPARIADVLCQWRDHKRDGNSLEPEGIADRALFERDAQFKVIERFLTQMV